MRIRLLAAAACLALLCSCNPVSFSGTESLLAAPKLNKRQAEVSRALESILSLRSIVYVYPQSGENRSPFVFYDFDGDGSDEAIVFYSRSDDTSGNVSAKILTQNADLSWSPFYDVSLPESNRIDFVRFDKITDNDASCMLIGCIGAGRGNPSSLAVYSMKDGAFRPEAITGYIHYSAQDFDGDGRSEIVIINRDGAQGRYYAALLRGISGRISTVSQVSLVSDVDSVLSITTGKLWDEHSSAIYIDESLDDSSNPTIATEILRISAGGLGMLCGGEPAAPEEQETPARSNYEGTFRDDDVMCADFDGDGTVEVPNDPVSLPGSEDIANAAVPRLIGLMHLTPGGFDIRRSAVINADAGYLVYFPERWAGNVTVESAPETAEWRFRKWNPDISGPADELLRIRVSSVQDLTDMFGVEGYITLETRGTAAYSAYIPKITGEGLAVSEPEVRNMFSLLPA